MRRRYRVAMVVAGLGLGLAAGCAAVKYVERRIRPHHPRLALHAGRLLLARPPRRALVITAHPDDLELLLGGTLARLAQAGTELTVVDLTDGERGAHRHNTAQLRQAEQMEAAEALAYSRNEFLHLPDRGLKHINTVAALWPIWQQTRPDAVFAFDAVHYPARLRHPDHLACGRAAMALTRASGGQVPLYLYGTSRPDVIVDIAPVLNQKIVAVQAHRSQLLGLRPLTGSLLRLAAHLQGRSCGLAFAEGLRRDRRRATP